MSDHRAAFADKLSYHLRRAHEAAQQSYATALHEIGLAPMHADVLALVAAHPGIKPSELAEALGRDRSSITAALHALEHRGLIDRQATTRDRRAALLHVSDAGRQTMQAVAAVAAAQDRLLDRIIGQDDKPHLIERLRRLTDALAQGGLVR